MEKVVIFGTTEIAQMTHFYLTHDSPYEVAAFTVDGQFLKEPAFCGLPVVPFEEIETQFPPREYRMMVSMAYGRVNRSRAEKYQAVKAKRYRCATYVSSKAVTWPGLVVGENTLVLEGSALQPTAQVGNDVIVSPGVFLGHHARIEDHCYLAPRAVVLGGVTIGPYSFLGANATVRDGVTIARDCIIGAGATIARHTKAGEVHVAPAAELLPISK